MRILVLHVGLVQCDEVKELGSGWLGAIGSFGMLVRVIRS